MKTVLLEACQSKNNNTCEKIQDTKLKSACIKFTQGDFAFDVVCSPLRDTDYATDCNDARLQCQEINPYSG